MFYNVFTINMYLKLKKKEYGGSTFFFISMNLKRKGTNYFFFKFSCIFFKI